MSLLSRVKSAIRRSNVPALAMGTALVGTFALSQMLERRKMDAQKSQSQSQSSAPQLAGWPFWKHVLYRTYQEINDDRLLALAAGVVFYGLLALFPAITALVSCYALFFDPATIGDHLATLQTIMPHGAYGIVQEQIARIVAKGAGGLSLTFLASLAFALWSANAGLKAIVDALNIVYGVKERRGFIRLNLVSLTMTVGAIGGLLLGIAAIVVLPVVTGYLPYSGYANTALIWLRWPALFALLLFGLALLYRFGPNRDRPRWQWISAGAVLAAIAWLGGSALLSWYLGNFANYDATYGSLGAGIGLMMWLWMTAIVVLVGAELNSEIDAARAPVARTPEAKIGGASRP